MSPTEIPHEEIFIVDDDPAVSDRLLAAFESEGYRVTSFNDGEAFLAAARSRTPACIILDVHMPGRSGLDILRDLTIQNYAAPIIIMSDSATIPMAVEAVKSGAFDIVEKPFKPQTLATRARLWIDTWARQHGTGKNPDIPWMEFPGCRRLTQREWEVLAEITAASSNKEAGRHLGLSPRTIEVHRAHIMMKLGAKNTADLVRLVLSK
jgi:two-component system response regulator FixJ